MSLANVGDILADQSNYVEAEHYCQEAQRIQRKTMSRAHPMAMESSRVLANVLYRLEKYSESITLYREILGDCLKNVSERDDRVLRMKTGLAKSLSAWASADARNKQNEPRPNFEAYQSALEAERLLRDCLAIRQADTNTAQWQIAETRSILGECLLTLTQSDTNRSPAALRARLKDAEDLLTGAHKAIQESPELQAVEKYDSFLRITHVLEALNTTAPNTVEPARIEEWNKQRKMFEAAR